MNLLKFPPRLLAFVAVALLATALSGCAGGSARAAQLAGGSWPSVTVEDETIYMAGGSALYAIEVGARTASPIWSFTAEERVSTIYSYPSVGNGLVVTADYSGNVYGIDRENGALVWQFTANSARFIGGSVFGENLLYIAGTDGNLYALDPDTGTEEWRFSAERDIWSAPLLYEDTLYITSLDGHLYAVNAETGDELWTFPENGEAATLAMLGTPVIYENLIIFASFNNELYALDLETHKIVWTYSTTNWVYTSPTVDEENGLLYGGDLEGRVFALNPASGEEAWALQTDGPVVSAPTLHEYKGAPAVFAPSGDGDVYIIDPASGEQLDQPFEFTATFTNRFLFFSTGESDRSIPLYAPVLFFNDLTLLTAHQGDDQLYAYDSESFVQQWTCCSVSE